MNTEARSGMSSRVPVDRGWAWVCAFGSMLISFTSIGCTRTMGLLYVDIMQEFNASAGTVSWIFGAQMATTVISPLVGMLDARYGARAMVTVGSMLSAVSLVVSSVAPNIYYVIVFSGIINGMGFSLMHSPGIGIISQYFNRHRALAIGIAISGSSLAQLTVPVIVGYWLQRFALRGTFLLYAGIYAHGLVSAALFRPRSFFERSKNFPNPEEPSHDGNNVVEGSGEKQTYRLADSRSYEEAGGTREREMSTKNHCPKSNAYSRQNIVCVEADLTNSCGDNRRRANTLNTGGTVQQTSTDIGRHRQSFDSEYTTSFVESYLVYESDVAEPEVPVDDISDDAWMLTKCFFAVFPRSLICNPAFVAFLVGCCPAGFFLMDSIILMPAMAEEAGIDKDDIVWLMFLVGAVELCSRIISGWLIDRCRHLVPPYYIAGGCCVLLAAGTLRCAIVPDYRSVVILCSLQGCFGGCLIVAVPAVLVELVGASLFARGYALISAAGFVNAFVIRILGMLRDDTGAYRASYSLLGALYIMPILVYTLVLPVIQRCQHRKTSHHAGAASRN